MGPWVPRPMGAWAHGPQPRRPPQAARDYEVSLSKPAGFSQIYFNIVFDRGVRGYEVSLPKPPGPKLWLNTKDSVYVYIYIYVHICCLQIAFKIHFDRPWRRVDDVDSFFERPGTTLAKYGSAAPTRDVDFF